MGAAHGQFLHDAEQFLSILQDGPPGGSVWDRMSNTERQRVLNRMQQEFDNLPRLRRGNTPEEDAALREGFAQRMRTSYDAARIEAGAVKVAIELSKLAILHQTAPTATSIGATFSTRYRDCAARTAVLALQDSGKAVDADFIIRNFGLPKMTINGFGQAVGLARNWFTQIGIELAPRGVDLTLSGAKPAGNYVLFFEGGNDGGHVIYGRVLEGGGMVLEDGQLGRRFGSVFEAQSALRMQFRGAFMITNITTP